MSQVLNANYLFRSQSLPLSREASFALDLNLPTVATQRLRKAVPTRRHLI